MGVAGFRLGNLGGEIICLLVLGFAGLMIGVVGWAFVIITTRERPRQRMRRVCSLGFGLFGYFVGGITTLLGYERAVLVPQWAGVGLLSGLVVGYIGGMGLGAWLGTESKEN